MAEFDMDLMVNFPFILSNSTNTECIGYLLVKNVRYPIDLKKNATNNKYSLKISEKLKSNEFEIRSLLEKNEFQHPVEILKKLKDIVTRNGNIKKIFVNHTNIRRKVLAEYTEFHNFHINIENANLNNTLDLIKIVYLDLKQREHHIIIKVNYDKIGFGLFNICNYDLPSGVFCSNDSAVDVLNDDSLICLYEKYLVCINSPQMQEYFDLMDEIDKSCWVLDPDVPSLKDNYRRIALTNKISIIISFNPTKMRELPIIKFLGPKILIEPLMEIHARNVLNWEPSCNILEEILKLLELSNFPTAPKKLSTAPENQVLLVNDGECCICCCLRLDGNLPEIICPNSSCSQYFHEDCLYQWLQSINMKIFKYEIIGKCPNCESTIKCPIPKPTST